MIYEFNEQLNITLPDFAQKFTEHFLPKVMRYESRIPLSWQGNKRFIIEGVSEVEARKFLSKLVEGNKMTNPMKAKDLVPQEQVVEFETVSVPKSIATMLGKAGVGMLLVAVDAVVTEAAKETEKENKDLKIIISGLNETAANQTKKLEKQANRIQALEDWTDNLKLPARKKPDESVDSKKV